MHNKSLFCRHMSWQKHCMTAGMHRLRTGAYHGDVSAHGDACVWTNVAVDIQENSENFCVFQLCFSGTECTELWLLCQGAPIYEGLLG